MEAAFFMSTFLNVGAFYIFVFSKQKAHYQYLSCPESSLHLESQSPAIP